MAVTTLNRSEQLRKTSNHNSVAYNDNTGTLTDGSTLTWDGTSLGVGTNITANSSTGAISATSASLSTALPVTSGGTGTTTSTGTGSVVLSNSPTLVTPALGTPSALVLTNATGTPTSIGLTNGTGLPLTTGVTGTLPIANGGTNSNAALSGNFLIVSSGGKLVEANGTDYSMDNGKITNVADPTNPSDAATKNYVDMAVNGLTWKSPVAAATTTVLPFSPTYSNGSSGVGATLTAGSNGVLVIDGYTVLLDDRVLVQNQASALQNGIYTVTTLGTVSVPYELTRAIDSNTPSDLQAGTATFATNGTTNADKGFLQTTTGTIVIGTTNLVYITFTSAVSSYFAGNGLDLTGSTFSISTDDTLTAFAGGSTPSLVLNLSGRTAGGILYDTNDSTGLHESSNFVWDNTSQFVSISATGGNVAAMVFNSPSGNGQSAVLDFNINGGEVSEIDANEDGSISLRVNLTSGPEVDWIFGADGSLLLPNLSSDPTGVEGEIVYNNTTHTVDWYNGTTWLSVGTGTLTSANFVTREIPSGTINGSNTTFILANTPTAGTECVYLNGLLQESGAGNDYTISGATITYLTAPQTGDRILVNYMK